LTGYATIRVHPAGSRPQVTDGIMFSDHGWSFVYRLERR